VLAPESKAIDIQKHLHGCLAGYQATPSYGSAVFFALEAIWGIAADVRQRAADGLLTPGQRESEWGMNPRSEVAVPWIWIAALGEAWDRYKSEGGPVGQAFGLEGGKGKNPISKNLDQLLGERAIARWVWHQVTSKRAQGEQCTIEAGIQEAAEFFNCSDTTIRRAWKRFGQEEKGRPTDRVTT